MHEITAANIVNQLIFRPGWSFSASKYYRPGTILVNVRFDTQDTNYPPYYNVPLRTGFDFALDVTNMNENDLMYAVKKEIEKSNDHEDREFLRFGHRMDAEGRPDAIFHPHHYEGEMLWRQHEAA